MVDFLNEDVTFRGEVATAGELVIGGSGLTIGASGMNYGDPVGVAGDTWPIHSRVRVADTTERGAVVAWRAVNDPITAVNPLLVWRADGSSTGVNEVTVDGVNWFAESPLSGDIEMTMAEVAPYGWLLLQGQLLANAVTNYPALWAAASTAFRVGNDLRLPDLRGRSPMGAGQGTALTLRNLGDATGTETVQLSSGQLPLHNHSTAHDHGAVNTGDSGSHDHTVAVRWRTDMDDGAGSKYATSGVGEHFAAASMFAASAHVAAVGGHQHLVSIPAYSGSSGNAGNNEAHPNVHPSSIINFKVKL